MIASRPSDVDQAIVIALQFVSMVDVGGKGPTMLLVKDKQGQLFGGYASEPWLKNGKFYGEVDNVFRLSYCCSQCMMS